MGLNIAGRSGVLLTVLYCWICLLFKTDAYAQTNERFYYVAPSNNNLITLLQKEKITTIRYTTYDGAIDSVPTGAALLLLADSYPNKIGKLTESNLKKIREKKLKVYTEYVTIATDTPIIPDTLNLERVVVTDNLYFKELDTMSLLNINGSIILPAVSRHPLLVTAKVAGFDKAIYGLSETPNTPLLYPYDDQLIVASTALSQFAESRFTPEYCWKDVWESILSHLSGENIQFVSWMSYVTPSFSRNTVLPLQSRLQSVQKGIDWFFNGHFVVDKSWKKDWVDRYIGDGSMPIGPELPANTKDGDGTQGILEGHCSYIYYDGTQKYRYWLRNDVQGESAMAFAVAGNVLGNKKYLGIAASLNDFSFRQFRQGSRNNPESPSYGLLSWAVTNEGTYYGDDNARSVLGSITAASLLKDHRWNKKILELITANFRTTGRYGFRGGMLKEEDLQKNGWKHYYQSDTINPHPHFEAWPWATFIWLYSQTKFKPFLERSKLAIRKTMEAYPHGWGWTNGIQQERARMLLPLAWLVRIEPTQEHKEWLDLMVKELLKNQVACGGIREELGDPTTGMFGRTKSNADYGKHEAPLIFNNGDPVSDMLYTTNFAFIGLNEAYQATGNADYKKALLAMSDFLTRIQVKSDRFKNLDGAWFRAFNYKNWDYWASNADAGWGAWSTLTGWIQSWIVSTQAFIEMDSSLWDVSHNISFVKDWMIVRNQMIPDITNKGNKTISGQ
uniref:Uncharacterized protein n=1 Tax=Sphingobacterium sp. (strain 21) TaxID=743722 RepID=F4CEK0_SPHS2